MTKRIFRSIFLVALTVFFASVLLIMGALYGHFSHIQQTQLNMQLSLAAQGVTHEGIGYFDGFQAGDCRVTWISAGGGVLYDSESDSAGMENHLAREEIQEAFRTGRGQSVRYSPTLRDRALYAAQLLPDGTVLRLSTLHRSVWALLLGILPSVCLVFLAAAGLSVFFAVRLSRRIVSPLAELDLDHPLDFNEYEELTPLLRRIDIQQRQLKQQRQALAQQEAELEKAEQVRREFTANVSHELKTPLQSISGYAELLQNGMVKQADIVPFAGKIHSEAQRMAHLVDDILNLSHLDSGAQDMCRVEVDLYETAAQAVRSLAPAAQAAGVTLHLTGGSAVLCGVPQLLHSIVYNLCDNGIKYNRDGGSVTVCVRQEPDSIVLSVSDTGIGIPADARERIFERFYRVDKSRSKEVGGTGLGLSIVKHAAVIHHAATEVHSTEGQGSTIVVRFPQGGAPPKTPASL